MCSACSSSEVRFVHDGARIRGHAGTMSNTDTLLLGLCPRLVVGDGAAAIDFYGRALGAQARERFTGPENRIVHALLAVGPVLFSVKDAGDGDPAPTSGGVPVILALEVTDADSVADRMLAAGAPSSSRSAIGPTASVTVG